MSDYDDFFSRATGNQPYSYQRRLAEEAWPTLLDIPTGLGKTAAVVLAWLYKRRMGDPDTPRRLVWCLPMRVLVEQTQESITGWLQRLGLHAKTTADEGVAVHLLMGGEGDTHSWVESPEREAILIGTQDMLLSRALMRGYGMSRYRWPIDFALLHHDTLWVFDEIQLMGAGLPTSAQLDAFRRILGGSARSLWISATLNRKWLDTIDFRPYLENATTLTLNEEEKQSDAVRRRCEAVKSLQAARARLDSETNKKKAKAYLAALAEEIVEAHTGDSPTLVILNNVQRSQDLDAQLSKQLEGRDDASELLLVHGRFRKAERDALNQRIREITPDDNLIIIATQAIEAGVDLTSRRLFAELAPWASLVQRFGRCNRGGEYEQAEVYWLDIESDDKLTAPYTSEELDRARAILQEIETVAAADLPPVQDELPLNQVIRRKDFLDLFNTDSDLSGFDIDISPWIRDGGTPPVQVYWRDFEGRPKIGQGSPQRDELCPVSIAQIREHLKSKYKGVNRTAFTWDALGRQWQAIGAAEVRPGMTLLLRAAEGGYYPESGFLAKADQPVPVLVQETPAETAFDDDRRSQIGHAVTLEQHLADVRDEAQELCAAVGEQSHADSVIRAAQWHDVGKSHRAFQTMLLLNDEQAGNKEGVLWAKGVANGRSLYATCGGPAGYTERRHFRHELASLLAWLEHGERDQYHDLIAYLIAAHHGKVRMSLRALPDEQGPGDSRRYARGIWDDDVLPSVDIGDRTLPQTTLRLDVMELGDGPMGPSWSTRTQRLLRDHGPFRLAWLEALVRLADWRASARYIEEGGS